MSGRPQSAKRHLPQRGGESVAVSRVRLQGRSVFLQLGTPPTPGHALLGPPRQWTVQGRILGHRQGPAPQPSEPCTHINPPMTTALSSDISCISDVSL